MVRVYLKDGALCQYDGITADSVKFNEERGFVRINGPDEIILIPWDNIRFVQAERPTDDEEDERANRPAMSWDSFEINVAEIREEDNEV